MNPLVRLLLHVFPKPFREHYGAELLGHLDQRFREVRAEKGELVALRVWLRNLYDIVLAGFAEQRDYQRSIQLDAPSGRSFVFSQNLQYGLRSMMRNMGFTAVVVLTLALGIGANTAVYSLVHGVLLTPLPYDEPARLVRIFTSSPPNEWSLSVADYMALEEQQTSFEQVAAFRTRGVTYNTDETADRILARSVTHQFFSTLGTSMALGRGFVSEEGILGSEPTVVISHRFWQNALGGQPEVLGKTLRLDGSEHRIVGVVAESTGPLEMTAQVFPILQIEPPSRKGPFFLGVLARLKQGVSDLSAESELREINQRIFPIWESSYKDQRATWGLRDLKEWTVGQTRTRLLLLLGAVVLVLLVACTNVANLLLARAADRAAELSVRAALGASRAQIAFQLLIESVLLATAGGVAGLVLSGVGIRAIRLFGADYIPRVSEVHLSGGVLLFTFAVTLASGLVFGILPALGRSGNRQLAAGFATGRITESRARMNLRKGFVMLQFASALPLLFGTVLLVRSLDALQQVELGFNPDNLLAVETMLPAGTYPEDTDRLAFLARVKEQVSALPGVGGVALADSRPPRGAWDWNNFDLEDQPTPKGQSQPVSPWVAASPDFFEVLGIPLYQGRLFSDEDNRPGGMPLVVDRTWAKRFFADEVPIGKRMVSGGCPVDVCGWNTIVGVVDNALFAGLEDRGEGVVYYPYWESFTRTTHLLIRTDRAPELLAGSVRKVFRELDPTLAISGIAPANQLVSDAVEEPRYVTALVGLFALVALLVSAVGIYGVMSYFVRRRTREIGVRMAVGGTPGDVFRRVVRDGMGLVLVGGAVGAGGALLVARFMTGMLFEIGPADPVSLVVAVTLLIAVALVACLAPARRASRVDPIEALRAD